MGRYIGLLLLATGVVFANPVVVTIINEVGIREDGQGWVELHSEPEPGWIEDLNGVQVLTASSVCTLTCSLRYDEFIIIDSAVLAQGIIGRGSFRLNPDSDRVVLIYPLPYPAESICYPVIPTGWRRGPAPPIGGSIAIFNDGSTVINWYIDSTPTPGEDNNDYSTIQGTVTWDSGLQVSGGQVVVSGDYGSGVWEIYGQPAQYRIRGLGAGRFWVAATVNIVGHGLVTVPYPESVDVGYSQTVSGINIHITLPGTNETEMTNSQFPMTKTTIVRGVLNLPQAGMTNAQLPITMLDISGRKVMALREGANDIRGLAPGVYFLRGVDLNDAVRIVITH